MKSHSRSTSARVLAGLPFFLVSIFLVVLTATDLSARARTRKSSPTRTNNLNLVDPALAVPTAFSGTYDPHEFPCSTPLNGPFAVLPGQVRIIVQVSATLPNNDLTVTLLFGPTAGTAVPVSGPDDQGTSSELLLYQPGGTLPTGNYWVQVCETPNPGAVPQTAPFDYNGTITIDNTGPVGGAPPPVTTNVPPAPLDNGAKIGFENFAAPGVLVKVKTTEGGQQPNGVEYMGRNAGEPSMSNNWISDTAVYHSGLETLFVKFDDSCPASGLSSTWVNRAAPTQVAVDSDPIGFTDSALGRTFTGELTLLTPTCKMSFTDDDGLTWVPTQGSGLAAGVDHETVGGGPYHAPIPTLPTPYNHAVYYCSQDTQNNSGLCSRSDDGGLTYGPSVVVADPTTNVCVGLHGHVKVAPDGTVYLPLNVCDGAGSVIVSEDNGITWTVRHVNNGVVSTAPSASFQDPAVSVDASGRVYFVIANNDTQAAVATSIDHGATWQNLLNVSDVYGLKNVRYPAAIAGDANRAAVAFYGTITPGDALQPDFKGIWHLYIAHTFDGGAHWTTTDATPNAPMQRGCIWAKGGANICRNLLDFFDMTVDKVGRVQVGYVNGCEGAACVQAPITAGESPAGQGNAYTGAAAIARQSSGRRLFAANDPAGATSKPGTPLLTERRVGNVVHLQWSEADTGNLMINNYQILRGTASGNETLLNTVAGTQTGGTYVDTLATNDTTPYYYKVVAVNSAGSSCPNNEVFAPYLGDTCSGLVIHRNDPTHPEANTQTATPPSMLIDYVAAGEPPNSSNLMFKMKVNSLAGSLPPNSRWRMVWNSYTAQAVAGNAAAQQWYCGMATDSNGVPSFTYGTLADAGVPAVFVISEQEQFTPDPASNYQPDGTITVYIPKSAVGNPPPGTLLGGVNARTFADNSVQHRSTSFIDHTFVKAQTDNSYPASTYLVSGNNFCSATGIAPIGAVSRKTHGTAGTFDIDLPLTGPEGIECRSGGANGNHTIVVTFPGPIASVGSASCGGQAATTSTNGSVVTVNCTGVPNAQDINITLTNVSDGTNVGNVSIPMGVLAGDTTGNRRVNSADVSQVQSQTGQPVTGSNFREDLTVDGRINSADVSLVQSKSGTALP